MYPQSMFWAKIRKLLTFFHLKIINFTAVKYCCILHGRVCVMFSETACPKPNFVWSLLGKWERKFINGTGNMTKMATMLIYGKKSSKIFSYRIDSPIIMKLGMEQYVLKLYKVYIKYDPELPLTHFKTMSNF